MAEWILDERCQAILMKGHDEGGGLAKNTLSRGLILEIQRKKINITCKQLAKKLLREVQMTGRNTKSNRSGWAVSDTERNA